MIGRSRTGALLPVGLGIACLLGAALIGYSEPLTRLVVAPPVPVRVMLGTAAVIIGGWLVLSAAERLESAPDARALLRAIRLVFLAVAAFAAGAGWFVGSALPIVAGLVIAGVDVLETSLLLLVAATRGDRAR